jgi:hypothetical protein
MKPKDVVLSLNWWKIHEAWFPNIFFAAWYVFGIHGSQIEIEKIFNVVGMLTSLQCYRLGIVIIMNNWLVDAQTNCPWEGQSIIEFLVEETCIIEENDMMLNATRYFNVDHELAWWIWKLMCILLKFLRSLFALIKIILMLALVAICNGQLNYLFLMMHKTMSFFNFQFKVLIKCDISL